MFDASKIPFDDRKKFYTSLTQEIESMITGYWLSDLSNVAALLYSQIPGLNWCGFYLNVDGVLKVGPFQGLPACVEIKFGKGVCGTSALNQKSILVKDVHQFDGHIACDSRSKSELVIPICIAQTSRSKVIGVLDLDSPSLAHFTEEDQTHLEKIVRVLVQKVKWPADFL